MVKPGIILVLLSLLFVLNVEIQGKSHVSEICGRGQGDKKPESPSQKKKERQAEENDDDPVTNTFFYQGDMRLTPPQKKKMDLRKKEKKNGQKRDVTSIASSKWKDHTNIQYELDNSLGAEAKTQIEAAVRDFEMYTCLRFKEKSGDPVHYITFKKGSGCWSYIGQLSKEVMDYYKIKQEISIGDGCEYKGTVIHEILHALGVHHEHSRLDRDGYVEILSANISPEMLAQFDVDPDQTSLGLAYDYNSVMHYPLDAFSMNGQPTLKIKGDAQGSEIGNRDGMSASDIDQIQLFYGCTSSQGREYLPKNETTSRRSGGKNKEKKKTNDEDGGKCDVLSKKQKNKS